VLNPEQKKAAHSLNPAIVTAGPGSGKTKTLIERVAFLLDNKVSPQEILCFTFTRGAAKEMKERLEERFSIDGLTVTTIHSFCLSLIREGYDLLGFKEHILTYDDTDSKDLKTIIAKENKWEYNARNEEKSKDIEKISKEYLCRLREYNAVNFDQMQEFAINLFRKGHMRHIQSQFRYIIVDEMQDTSDVDFELIKHIAKKHRNVFGVGDIDQCVVKGTLVDLPDGNKKPIELINEGDEILSCFGSGKFRKSTVSYHKKSKSNNIVRIELDNGYVLESTPDHTHFAGYVTGHTPEMHVVYLMYKNGLGFRTGVSGTYAKSQYKPRLGISVRCNHEKADALWVISSHNNDLDARYEEARIAAKYGLIKLPFVARKSKTQANGNLSGSQEHLDRLFGEFGSNGYKLLFDNKLRFDEPHIIPSGYTASDHKRRVLNIILCGDCRGKYPTHRISFNFFDADTKEALESLGLNIRSAGKGRKSMRFETSNSSMKEIHRIANLIASRIDVVVKQSIRLASYDGDRNSLPMTYASSVRDGMVMACRDGKFHVVKSVEHINGDFEVYDINVNKSHNFIANGIITHNCIFEWRGANPGLIKLLEKYNKDGYNVELTKSYRCPQKVLDLCNTLSMTKLVSCVGDGDDPVFNEFDCIEEEAESIMDICNAEKPKSVGILCRTNKILSFISSYFVERGFVHHVVGDKIKMIDDPAVRLFNAFIKVWHNHKDYLHFFNVMPILYNNIPTRQIRRVRSKSVIENKTLLEVARDDFDMSIFDYGSNDFVDLVSDRLHKWYTERSMLTKAATIRAYQNFINEWFTNNPGADLEDFVFYLSDLNVTEDSHQEVEENPINMLTIHASKGLEFDYVFIPQMNKRAFRSNDRNVVFVAMSRTKKKLHMSYSKFVSYGEVMKEITPSIFLEDMNLLNRR